MKRYTVLLLGAGALLLTAPWVATAPAFSRSRWIAEHADRLLFSGGVLPADPAAVAAAFAARRSLLAAPVGAGKPDLIVNFRVSFDILGGDAGNAEPETEAEPYLAFDPEREDRLLAGYQEDRFPTLGGARALVFATSSGSGRQWREGLLPNLTLASGGSFERATDPWIAFGLGGRAYYAALAFDETNPRNGIFVSASNDGGRTWDDPVTVHESTTQFDDKEAIAVDVGADSPFRGRIYVGWDTTVASDQEVLRVAYSTDDGRSFTSPVDLESVRVSNLGILPLIDAGGIVYAVWLHEDPSGARAIHSARSEDGGNSWSAPLVVSAMQQGAVTGMRTGVIPAAAIDPAAGTLYVVWQDGRFSSGVAQVVLSRSTDGGRTWSAPRRVSDGPLDAPSFTPAVAVNGEGQVAVSYYTLRNDPDRRFFADEYIALSADGGQTFLPGRRVSEPSFDVRFAAVSDGFFLGDYQGLVGGRQLFRPFWIATFAPSRRHPAARQSDAYTRLVRP
jgi:hypothetical protein